ncbi:MAG TPA: GGDEF domain-containing protein, partial [Thiomicrospira sp.]|nr:GGDEF domain-containing protein [Thiomicrospira sp.]
NQREHDVAFRYGGEEFLLFVSNISEENTVKVAERIRAQVEKLVIEWEGVAIPLTMSIGALVIEPEKLNDALESYIEKADQNLYEAKETGRNKVVISTYQSE